EGPGDGASDAVVDGGVRVPSSSRLTPGTGLPRIGQILRMAPMTFKPQVLGKGLLTLWLVILAGCQTTSNHTDRTATPHGISGQSVSESAQRSARNARWRAPAEQDEPHTLWTRIRGGFQLDPALIDSPRVDKQRLHYVSQSRYFDVTSERAQRYLHYVVEELDKRGMPLELALLPFVESGYNPLVYSRSQAAG